ncbi:ankyrin repeat-containing domain protein [Aspergillus filifer]
MALLSLPRELLIMIAKLLKSEKGLNVYARSCRLLYNLTIDHLYHNNIKEHGSFALFWAAEYGIIETVRKCLAQGADVDMRAPATSDWATTPTMMGSALCIATAYRHESIAILLLYNGADVNFRDGYHRTPLRLTNGREPLLKLLLDRGANVNSRDGMGRTPLMTAVNDDNVNSMLLLLQAGARVNVKDNRGQSANFHAAGRNRSIAVMKTLSYHGAKINVIDNDGETPLSAAAYHESEKPIMLLLQHSADQSLLNRSPGIRARRSLGIDLIERVKLLAEKARIK